MRCMALFAMFLRDEAFQDLWHDTCFGPSRPDADAPVLAERIQGWLDMSERRSRKAAFFIAGAVACALMACSALPSSDSVTARATNSSFCGQLCGNREIAAVDCLEVDDRSVTAEVEDVLSISDVPRAAALLASEVGERVLYLHALT